MQIKVLSWNTWIDSNIEDVFSFLKNSNADIYGLQEVEDIKERDVIGFMSNLGFHHAFAPVEKIWGTAVSGGKPQVFRDGPVVFSKFPIVKVGTYMLSDEETRSAARADIEISNRIISVFSTHLIHTHQKPSNNQEEQARTLLSKVPRENSIVMGDLNATPDSNAIKILESELKNADPTNQPTWSIYPAGCLKCNPQKIDTVLDYIFVTNDIEVESFQVLESKASDHLPIMANLQI